MKPNAGKARLRPELERTAEAARETLAAELFDMNKVRAALVSRSGKGFTFHVVPVPGAFDLRNTKAAELLVTWLDEEKIEHRWTPRAVTGEAPADGGNGFELVISWGKKQIA